MAPQQPQLLPNHSIRCSQTNTTVTCIIPLANAKPKQQLVSEDGLEVLKHNYLCSFPQLFPNNLTPPFYDATGLTQTGVGAGCAAISGPLGQRASEDTLPRPALRWRGMLLAPPPSPSLCPPTAVAPRPLVPAQGQLTSPQLHPNSTPPLLQRSRRMFVLRSSRRT